MSAVLSPSSTLARLTAAVLAGTVMVFALGASMLSVLADCVSTGGAAPSELAKRTIPADYAELYQQAGAGYGVPWPVLAAIGAIESDHGRSTAPGVQSGVNAFGCCAGPMQFNVKDGPPSSWQTYRVDGDGDGDRDPYDPADAIGSAANYLRALLERAHGDVAAAVRGYNHSAAYVADVLARARAYSDDGELAVAAPSTGESGGCSGTPDPVAGEADLRGAERRDEPRAYAMLPAWAMAGGRPAEPIDARLLDNAVWILRTYRLRVTAAREAGHRTHGDGTALDLVPAEPIDQAGVGRLRGRAGPRPRLDGGLRQLGESSGLPARARDPVRRLRRVSRTRLAPHVRRAVRGPFARVLGLPVLRHFAAIAALRVGEGAQAPAADGLTRPRPAVRHIGRVGAVESPRCVGLRQSRKRGVARVRLARHRRRAASA